MNKYLHTLFITTILITNLFSAAPVERYHVEPKELDKDILKNTIGILTLNSGIKRGLEFNSYRFENNSYDINKIISVSETIPISNFGYFSLVDTILFVQNYRYPILTVNTNYYEIVYDVKNDKRTWVNINNVENSFHTSLFYYDKIETYKRIYFDIFTFNFGDRKVYSEPDINSDYQVLQKADFDGKAIKVLEQDNEFLKIGIVKPEYDKEFNFLIEPIGWINIRDKDNNITIWIKMIDLS